MRTMAAESRSWTLFFTVAICTIQFVSCNLCTDVLKRNRVEEVTIKVPCTEKYTARCGWLSLNYCTFYRSTFCDKKMNDTITSYYIRTDCCKGFYKAENGTCLRKLPGVDYTYLKPTPKPSNITSTGDPGYVIEPIKQPVNKKKKTELSAGCYAGIACGFVFFLVIVAFIINGIRKRRRAQHKDQKQDTTQQVLYMGQVPRSAERMASVASCMPPPPSSDRSKPSCPVTGKTTPSVTGKTTPSGLQTAENQATATPLLSDVSVKSTVPESISISENVTGATPLLSGLTTPSENVQKLEADTGVVPLLSKALNEDDIPESDV